MASVWTWKARDRELIFLEMSGPSGFSPPRVSYFKESLKWF
jgi:hypothetical protein